MSRRRTMLMNGQEENEMKEWKLIKEVTLSEDANHINIELGSEYEELDILCFITSSKINESISNTNMIVTLTDSDGATIQHMCIGGFAKNDKIVIRGTYTKKPYPTYTQHLFASYANSINDCINGTTIINHSQSVNRSMNGDIKNITMSGVNAEARFGAKSTVAVYAR